MSSSLFRYIGSEAICADLSYSQVDLSTKVATVVMFNGRAFIRRPTVYANQMISITSPTPRILNANDVSAS
jgi:hypothetical protein